MLDTVYKLLEAEVMITILVSLAAFATVITLTVPLLETDKLRTRMRGVTSERERLRAKQKAALETESRERRLRQKPKGLMAQLVEQLNLRRHFEAEDTRDRLRMAGLRSERQLYTFLFLRGIMPIALGIVTYFYMYTFYPDKVSSMMRLVITIGALYVGMNLPNMFVKNLASRRQDSIKRNWSDALDILLICVESGMSIESAFQRVAREIGGQSVPLAEEMSLTTAELSYLQDRKRAFDNLGKRTGLLTVKSVVTSLIQAERYGTPLGQALRVLAQENRDMRMMEAEKKAAALPPKLTVPMVLFFLPIIFIVILGPTAVKVLGLK